MKKARAVKPIRQFDMAWTYLEKDGNGEGYGRLDYGFARPLSRTVMAKGKKIIR